MQSWFTKQTRRNVDSRDGWSRFQPHREHVTNLLIYRERPGTSVMFAAENVPISSAQGTNTARPRERLLVLGAGNCNDLDLSRLTEHFAEVHLVDMDGAALAWGVAQQSTNQKHPDRIALHGGIDLCGIADACASWRPQSPPNDAALTAVIEQAQAAMPLRELADFDVTASVCLLSQMIEIVAQSLGDAHPRFLEMIAAIRLRHLQLLFESLREKGTGVLVTDFVSSATCSELATVAEADLPGLLKRLIAARNFFSGLNPFVLEALLHQSPDFSARVTSIQLSRPWRWDLGPRVYACCALSATLVK